MNQEQFFQEAKKHPHLRPEFVESLDLGRAAEYIERISYLGSDSVYFKFFYPKALMATKNKFEYAFKAKGIRADIIISPHSFGAYHQNSNDFLSTLVDHEGNHAEEFFKFGDRRNFRLVACDVIKFLLRGDETIHDGLERLAEEYRATKNQIENFKNRRCSDMFKRIIFSDMHTLQKSMALFKS